MRARQQRKTQRGIGETTEPSPESTPAPPGAIPDPPPSSRGIVCPPSEHRVPAGRLAVQAPARATRAFEGAPGSGAGRAKEHATRRMPACVEEAQPATRIIEEGHAATTFPQRLPQRERIELAPLGARDGFVLSLVDGASSVQALLDISSLGKAELASILDRLVGLGLITLA